MRRQVSARVVAGMQIAACVVLVIACGSGGDEPSTQNTAPAATAAASGSTAAAVPARTAEPAGDVAAVPVEQRGGERLEIGGNPDWLAAAGDALWVKTDSGALVRVDPDSLKTSAPVAVADALCQGIGAGDDAVWSCAGETGQVVRVDPASRKVAATVEAGKINAQGQIPIAFGHAWVLVDDGSKLVGIADDAVAKTIELGTVCTELTATATALWAACPTDGLALKIDPEAGEVVARVEGLPKALTIAAGEDVWVGFDGGLARIDEATGEVTAVVDAAPGPVGGIAVTDDAVWVRAEGRFLRRVDPATAEVVEDVTAPEQSGGSVIVAFGSIWATASDDDALYRVDAEAS